MTEVMESEKELNLGILKISMTIQENYPQLSELSETISNEKLIDYINYQNGSIVSKQRIIKSSQIQNVFNFD